nr:MAG TPA: hypothetical protein [Caudoviricetes sp.]
MQKYINTQKIDYVKNVKIFIGGGGCYLATSSIRKVGVCC